MRVLQLPYMHIHQQVKDDATQAMKDRDALRRDALRGLLSMFTNEAVANKQKPDTELTDEEAITVIKRAVKQRQDSAKQYRDAGRDELAEKEEQEEAILSAYLPETMSREEITEVVREKARELGISDASKAGQLMGAVMPELKDKADGGDVKAVVNEVLGAS